MADDEEELRAAMDDIINRRQDLEPFRYQFQELIKQCDVIAANSIGKTREYETYNTEINALKEQNAFTRRNIEEIISNQEHTKLTTENIILIKNGLSDSEKSNRHEISIFSGYFDEIKAALSVGADWTPSQLEEKNTLEKEREHLQGKLDNKKNQLDGQRSEVEAICYNIQQFETTIAEGNDNVAKMNKDIKDYEIQIIELKRNKNDIDTKLFDLRASIIKLQHDYSHRVEVQSMEVIGDEKLNAQLEALTAQMDVNTKEYEVLLHTLNNTSNELSRMKSLNEKLEIDIADRQKYVAEKNADSKVYSKEMGKIIKVKEVAVVKCNEADSEKEVAESKRDDLAKKADEIRRTDLIAVRREIENLEKSIATVKQEIEIVRKKNVSSEKVSKQIVDLIQLNINGKRNLNNEIVLIDEDINEKNEGIRRVLIEKERYEHEAEVTNQLYYTALEELKLQELQIHELQKKITDDQGKLKYKQSLYEAIRADRNLYSKQLSESQDELVSFKRKFKEINYRIEQLKDEVSIKDHSIVKEHFLHHSVDKERELLKNELNKIRKQVVSSEAIVGNQRVEVLKLIKIIEEADMEAGRQRNELASVISERNLLTGQIVKRNYELGLVYDKIKLQRSNLRIGEHNFNKLVERIAEWQKQLIAVVHEHADLINKVSGLKDYQNRIVQLEKELLKEQVKARAIDDELEHPMNIHRWRILESSDPKRYEKISQVQSLQRQCISKADDVTRYDLLIQEKEKVYVELKNILARQPGPEVEEQILIYQQTLKDKSKQLVSMDDELYMYRRQVGVFKEELAALDEQMNRVKKKWFKAKSNYEGKMQ